MQQEAVFWEGSKVYRLVMRRSAWPGCCVLFISITSFCIFMMKTCFSKTWKPSEILFIFALDVPINILYLSSYSFTASFFLFPCLPFTPLILIDGEPGKMRKNIKLLKIVIENMISPLPRIMDLKRKKRGVMMAVDTNRLLGTVNQAGEVLK